MAARWSDSCVPIHGRLWITRLYSLCPSYLECGPDPYSGHLWKFHLQPGLTALNLHVRRSSAVCAGHISAHTFFLQRGYRHGGTEEQNS